MVEACPLRVKSRAMLIENLYHSPVTIVPYQKLYMLEIISILSYIPANTLFILVIYSTKNELCSILYYIIVVRITAIFRH